MYRSAGRAYWQGVGIGCTTAHMCCRLNCIITFGVPKLATVYGYYLLFCAFLLHLGVQLLLAGAYSSSLYPFDAKVDNIYYPPL